MWTTKLTTAHDDDSGTKVDTKDKHTQIDEDKLWIDKNNHGLKRRWENLRGEIKNAWINGADTWILNLYFTFKRQWRRDKIDFLLKMLGVEEMVLG